MINFNTDFADRWTQVNKSFGAFMTIKDYIRSQYNKLIDWMSSEPTRAETVTAVPILRNGVTQIVGITQSAVQRIMQGSDAAVTVLLNDNDTDTVSADVAYDAITDMVADLKAQEVFIDSVISQEAETSTQFVTQLKLRYPGIAEDICEKYASIIDISGDPMSALRNFLMIEEDNPPEVTNTYITVNTTDYTGNVALAAWCKPGQAIIDWFSGIKWSWKNFGDFLARVGEGIVTGIKWISSKLFGELTTNYTKGSSRNIGVLDVPLFQMGFSLSSFNDFVSALEQSSTTGELYSGDLRNYCLPLSNIAGSVYSDYLRGMIHALNKDHTTGVSQILEFVVPTDIAGGFDVLFQFGEDQPDHYMFSAYPVCSYTEFSTRKDSDVTAAIFASLGSVLRRMSSFSPMMFGKPNYTSGNPDSEADAAFYTLALMFFWDYTGTFHQDPDLPKNLILLHATDDVMNDYVARVNANTATQHDHFVASFLLSALIYAIRYARGAYIQRSTGFESADAYLNALLFNPTYNLYSPTDATEEYDPDGWTSVTNDDYTPFTLNSCMGVAVHYQSVDEQAAEILKAVVVLVSVVLVIAASAKFMKWRKKRRIQGNLMQANVDSKSWEYAANPTQANYDAWYTAYKANRRFQRLNTILGLAPSAGVAMTGDDNIKALMGLAKADNDNSTSLAQKLRATRSAI